MRNKFIHTLVLACIVTTALCFAGCSSDNKQTEKENTQEVTEEETSEADDSEAADDAQDDEAANDDGASNNEASDNNEFVSGNIKYTADITSTWESNDETFYQYVLTLENTSDEEIDGWEIEVKYSDKVKFSNGWNGEYKEGDSSITISSMDYNEKIAVGGKVTDVGFIISGSDELKMVQ